MSFLHEPGDLAQTPLAAVLLEALNHHADGVLAVEHGGGTSRLWFRDGRPVGAQVFTGFRPLGHMLLQAGKIDVDALSRSLAETSQGPCTLSTRNFFSLVSTRTVTSFGSSLRTITCATSRCT